MGQKLDKMGQLQSKDELLYQAAIAGNVEGIRALCSKGAGLEWIDSEGKTALIVACMSPEVTNVARKLIEMGANVNAYRPGRNAGTPLHHAAKRGLEQTVELLLSNGANAFLRNDDCYTPLDVARIKGYTTVVRTIENHISYFSGWLREFCGPGFLGGLAPQFLSRKIWVVILPYGSGNHMKPPRLELAIYSTLQDAQPRAVIALWKAKIEEPKFNHSDPYLSIYNQSTKTRYKLASGREGDKQQLQWIYRTCRGVPQVMPSRNHGIQTSGTVTTHQAAAASLHSASRAEPTLPPSTQQISDGRSHANGWGNSVAVETYNGWGPAVGPSNSVSSSSGWAVKALKEDDNGWGVPDSRPIGKQSECVQIHAGPPPLVQTTFNFTASVSAAPSAPPIPEDLSGEGLIHYPSNDLNPEDLSFPAKTCGVSVTNDAKDRSGGSSSCVICWEAPIEGACIPCGHMAGCMSCLKEIKAKKGLCPVCRSKMDQVIRLYAV